MHTENDKHLNTHTTELLCGLRTGLHVQQVPKDLSKFRGPLHALFDRAWVLH